MAEETPSRGLVSQGQGTGLATVVNSTADENFLNIANNVWNIAENEKQQKKLQEQQDKKEALKQFETDYAFSDTTWKPFEDKLASMMIDYKTKAAQVFNDNPNAYKDMEQRRKIIEDQEKIKAFAKKGRDIQLLFDDIWKSTDKLEKEKYDVEQMRADLMEFAKKPVDEIEKFDLQSMGNLPSDAKYIKLSGVVADIMKNVKPTLQEDDIIVNDSAYKSHIEEVKTKFSPFIKTKTVNIGGKKMKDKNGNIVFQGGKEVKVLDVNPLTGLPQIDTDSPAFMNFMESDPLIQKSLNFQVKDAIEKGIIPANDIEAQKAYRIQKAVEAALPLQAAEQTIKPKDRQDKTLEAQRLWLNQRQFDFEQAKEAGVSEVMAIPVNDLAALMNGDETRYKETVVIDGKTYKQADASNVFGGTLDEKKGIGLKNFLIDKKGDLFYTTTAKSTPIPIAKDDFSLLNNLVTSNVKGEKERQAIFNYLSKTGAMNTKTGKMDFGKFRDKTVGKVETVPSTKSAFEAAKKYLLTEGGKLTNSEYVKQAKDLLETYEGAELDYKGEKYTNVQFIDEDTADEYGTDIRIKAKNSKGEIVDLGGMSDFSKEQVSSLLQGFNYKSSSAKAKIKGIK
jgi:hypothetical protein